MSYTVHNWQSPLLRYYLLDRTGGGLQPPPLIKSKNNFNLLGTSPVDWEVQEVNRHLCSQTPQQCTQFTVTHEHKTVFQQINIVSSFPSPWHTERMGCRCMVCKWTTAFQKAILIQSSMTLKTLAHFNYFGCSATNFEKHANFPANINCVPTPPENMLTTKWV